MDDFTVQIKETSKELTKIERVRMKDISNAIKLDEATNEGPVLLNPESYVILAIHNPKSDNPDYDSLVIVDDAGTKFVTGSNSFIRNFLEIWGELAGESGWSLECYKRESKNYKGKQFLTCSVA